jgi:DNA-directed RNA polymerase delta subunit
MRLQFESVNTDQSKTPLERKMIDISIKELNLSVRAYNVLKKKKLETVRDIIEFGPNNIINLRNAGKKTVEEILEAIKQFNQSDNILSPYEANPSPSVQLDQTRTEKVLSFEDLIKSKFDENLLSTPIDELDISARALNGLKKAGLKTIGDILNFGLQNFMENRNIGRKTIEEIKNAILVFQKGKTHNINEITFIDTINGILTSLSPRDLPVIKSRYGYEDGKRETLEQIGIRLGITRERVRQIQVKAINQIKRKEKKSLQRLIEAIEGLLLKHKGIICVKDIAKDKYFALGKRNQLSFLMNLIVDLYEERYRIIYKFFLTSLSDNEIKLHHSDIRKAALTCRFPIKKKDFIKSIASSVGPISKHYLVYYLVYKEHIQVTGEKVLSPGRLSVPQRVKLIMRKINEPMHFTEIVKLYVNHFGDTGVKTSDLEHALHARIADSRDFILVGPGTFLLKEKFKLPDNIETIVEKARDILLNLGSISDTGYLIKELKKRNISVGNLNAYSLKDVLLDYPGFVGAGYGRLAIGIEEYCYKYKRKSLNNLIYEILLSSSKPVHWKEIWKELQKRRGFASYVVTKCLYDDPAFIKFGTATYTVKENINMYDEKRNIIIDFVKEWIKLKGNPISAFFVNEVLKQTEEIKDLFLGLVQHVLATCPDFIRLPNGFYDLNIQGRQEKASCTEGLL